MIKARISLKHSVGKKKKSSSESELLHLIASGHPPYWLYIRFKSEALCIPSTNNDYHHEPATHPAKTIGSEPFPSRTVVTMVQE